MLFGLGFNHLLEGQMLLLNSQSEGVFVLRAQLVKRLLVDFGVVSESFIMLALLRLKSDLHYSFVGSADLFQGVLVFDFFCCNDPVVLVLYRVTLLLESDFMLAAELVQLLFSQLILVRHLLVMLSLLDLKPVSHVCFVLLFELALGIFFVL